VLSDAHSGLGSGLGSAAERVVLTQIYGKLSFREHKTNCIDSGPWMGLSTMRLVYSRRYPKYLTRLTSTSILSCLHHDGVWSPRLFKGPLSYQEDIGSLSLSILLSPNSNPFPICNCLKIHVKDRRKKRYSMFSMYQENLQICLCIP